MTDRLSIQDRNTEGQVVVDFAKRMEMAVMNSLYQKRQEHQVDYILTGSGWSGGASRGLVHSSQCDCGDREESTWCDIW